jgi:hypothetical protein
MASQEQALSPLDRKENKETSGESKGAIGCL